MLPQRILHRQPVELPHQLRVTTRRQIGIDAGLDRRQTQLAQPGDLCVERRTGLDIGIRQPPPHRQRVPQGRRGDLGIVGAHVEGGAHLLLETERIHRLGRHRQHVPAPVLGDDVAHFLADQRDERLHRPARSTGRVVVVEVVDDAIQTHRPALIGDQHRQNAPLLRTTHRHRRPVAPNLQRAQHLNLQSCRRCVGRRGHPALRVLGHGNHYAPARQRTFKRAARGL